MTLNLGDASVTFGVAVNEEFSLAQSISERDASPDRDDAPGGFPYVLDDVFNDTLEMSDDSGSTRTGFFTGDELTIGTLTGTFTKPAGPGRDCILELRVFITVE